MSNPFLQVGPEFSQRLALLGLGVREHLWIIEPMARKGAVLVVRERPNQKPLVELYRPETAWASVKVWTGIQ